MATNKRQITGKRITLTFAEAHDAGDPVAVGGITGVLINSNPADGRNVIDREGVYALSVHAHDGSAGVAVAVGDPLFLDAANKILNKDDSGVFFGYALNPVTAGTTQVIDVLLAGGTGPV